MTRQALLNLVSRLVGIVLLSSLASGIACALEPPRRVVSINLCADQLAVLLLPPDRLLSVSFIARDPDLSYVAARAAAFPVNRGGADEVLAQQPDLVLAGRHATVSSVSLLRRLGVEVYEIDIPSDIDGIARETEKLGDRLGLTDHAASLVAEMRRRIAAVGADQLPAAQMRAAFYYPNGFSEGRGTLADAVLKAAGLRNVADEAGLHGLGSLPLELLLTTRPDLLILQHSRANAQSLAARALLHPALYGRDGPRKIAIPEALLACGAPFVAEAVEQLAAAARQP